MLFKELGVRGVYLIELERRSDERGYFARMFCEDEFAQHGLCHRFIQVNTGFNPQAGTLRGMHYQEAPHAEVKLVRCARGRVFDVALDLRPESPTYRQWAGVELSAEAANMLYVPEGCAHGYLTLEADTELAYFTSCRYAPGAARGVRFDDAAFGIQWPAPAMLVSKADREWPAFAVGGSAART